jgi:hypothetical protein
VRAGHQAAGAMLTLFTDETNLTPDATAKFFAYGGLVIDAARLPELHDGVEKIRRGAGYRAGDELKFDTRARPEHVTIDACTAAKREVIQLCIALETRFIAYVVLHAIAKNKPAMDLVRWGANHVIGRFNYFCSIKNSFGAVIVDRLPAGTEYAYLSDKFSKGLEFPEDPPVRLDRIHLFAASTIGASHACSAMDIVLGSFRYCINDPKNVEAAKEMMANVTRLLWHERRDDEIYAMGRGLIFAPKIIKWEPYKAEYDHLLAHINALIAEMK